MPVRAAQLVAEPRLPWKWHPIPAEKNPVPHYSVPVLFGERFDSVSRVVGEMTQNWHDEVIRPCTADDNQARRDAGTPRLFISTHYDGKVTRFVYKGNGDYCFGEMWFSSIDYYLQAGPDGDTIKGPFLLTNNNHTKVMKMAMLYRIGETTKAELTRGGTAMQTDLAGMNGEGLKIAASIAMRYQWDLRYIVGTNQCFFGYGTRPLDGSQALTLFNHAACPNSKGTTALLSSNGSIHRVALDVREFLFLGLQHDPVFADRFEFTLPTGERTILFFAPELRGMIWIKGFFVRKDPKLSVGFSTNNAFLDRDRLFEITPEQLTRSIWKTWIAACIADPRRSVRVYDLFLNDSGRALDVASADPRQEAPPVAFADLLAGVFLARHGEHAFPSSMAERTRRNIHYTLGSTPVELQSVFLVLLLWQSARYNNQKVIRCIEDFSNARLLTSADAMVAKFQGYFEAIKIYARQSCNGMCLRILVKEMPPGFRGTASGLDSMNSGTKVLHLASSIFAPSNGSSEAKQLNTISMAVAQIAFEFLEIPRLDGASFFATIFDFKPEAVVPALPAAAAAALTAPDAPLPAPPAPAAKQPLLQEPGQPRPFDGNAIKANIKRLIDAIQPDLIQEAWQADKHPKNA